MFTAITSGFTDQWFGSKKTERFGFIAYSLFDTSFEVNVTSYLQSFIDLHCRFILHKLQRFTREMFALAHYKLYIFHMVISVTITTWLSQRLYYVVQMASATLTLLTLGYSVWCSSFYTSIANKLSCSWTVHFCACTLHFSNSWPSIRRPCPGMASAPCAQPVWPRSTFL